MPTKYNTDAETMMAGQMSILAPPYNDIILNLNMQHKNLTEKIKRIEELRNLLEANPAFVKILNLTRDLI